MFTFPIKNLLFDIHPVFSDICRSCIAITKAVREYNSNSYINIP